MVRDLERGDLITLPIAWLIVLCSCGPSALLVLITLVNEGAPVRRDHTEHVHQRRMASL